MRNPILLGEMIEAVKRASQGVRIHGDAITLKVAAQRLELIKPQLYLDCDGVLADFDKKAREVFGGNPRAWEDQRQQHHAIVLFNDAPEPAPEDRQRVVTEINARATELASKDFWAKLYSVDNLFEELDVMPGANELVEAVKHLNPIILTGCPRGYWAVPQKLRWRDKHFPDLPMICVESINKRAHCRPGDVLVDDWAKYQRHWENEGGVFVLHESVGATLSRLKELGLL